MGKSIILPVNAFEQYNNDGNAFGFRSKLGESVGNILNLDPVHQTNPIIQEVKENVYKSKKTMPLGHSADLGYEFPERVQKEDFSFGNPSGKGYLNRWWSN